MKQLVGYVCGALSLLSLMFVFFAIGDIVAGDPDGTGMGILVGLLVFFAAITYFMAKQAKHLLSSDKQTQKKDIEREILMLARASNGILTVAELAANSDLSIAESEERLEKMVIQGVAQMELKEDGSIHYIFPGLRK